MAYVKKELSALRMFLPEGTYEWIIKYFQKYPIALSLTKTRKTMYGSYVFDSSKSKHLITVNGSLHPYQFLLTLTHEIAHLICFVRHGRSVAPHGAAWKKIFSEMLQDLLQLNVLPQDVHLAIANYSKNMRSSQCYDATLMQTLRKYSDPDLTVVSNLKPGEAFITDKKKEFQVIKKLRTRYQCQCIQSGALYLFPAEYAVKKVDKNRLVS